MKTAVLVFIEHQLGGLGTQAFDFARTAYEMHGCGKVVAFSNAKKNTVTPLNKFTAVFGPSASRKKLQLQDCCLSTNFATSESAFAYLSQFDRRIWVGLAPHCKTPEETAFFAAILESLPGQDHAFVTDRYIDELYPWVVPYLRHFSSIHAFADTYARAVNRHAPCSVLPLAPLAAWKQKKFVAPSKKQRKIFWPHQWRGWKNIDMFLDVAPKLGENSIDCYASGAGFEYAAYRRTPQYRQHVRQDVSNAMQQNKGGCLNLKGFAPHAHILHAYAEHKCVPDLSGISSVRKAANKYVGNYQCATLEPMAFGCALLKFSTTVAPHSAIPKEAVYLLQPEADDYAPIIKKAMNDDAALDAAARNAYEWLEKNCDPYALFERAFYS